MQPNHGNGEAQGPQVYEVMRAAVLILGQIRALLGILTDDKHPEIFGYADAAAVIAEIPAFVAKLEAIAQRLEASHREEEEGQTGEDTP